MVAKIGVSLDIENDCTASLFFEPPQALLKEKKVTTYMSKNHTNNTIQ